MGKIIITIPDDMHKTLREVSKKEDKVISALVRRAISEFLAKEYGIEVDHAMHWGRPAESGEESSEDE
jgi:hypothetical protein